MNRLASLFVKSASLYLLIGMAIGIGMAMSGDHRIAPAHAHLNLLGFVAMFLFAIYYQLVPAKAGQRLAEIHFWVWTIALWGMIPSLILYLLGNPGAEAVVGVASILMIAGAAIFAVVVFRPEPSPALARA